MKKNIFSIFNILIIFVFNSCEKNKDNDITNITIEYLGDVCELSNEKISECQKSTLDEVFIINSKEQGYEIFDLWNVAPFKIVEEYNYEEYTILLRFFSSKMRAINIEHHLYYENGNENEYKYLLKIKSHSDYDYDSYRYYCCIIFIKKIANDYLIHALTSSERTSF